ncbi:MAG: hypothetical protein QM749_00445 [Aquabacterium sp.]
MKMAKASEADLTMAIDLANAFEAFTNRWCPAFPDEDDDTEETSRRFDRHDPDDCEAAMKILLAIATKHQASCARPTTTPAIGWTCWSARSPNKAR